MKTRTKKLNKEGSFLVEVLLTVIILSVSLTLIIRSLASSLRATAYSSEYSSAVFLADSKLFDITVSQSVPSGESGYFAEPYDKYSYEIKKQDAGSFEDIEGIDEVTLKVMWDARGKKKSISVKTLRFEDGE